MKRISVNKKVMLFDKIGLRVKGITKIRTLEYFIENHPEVVYYHVYDPSKYRLKPIETNNDGITLLKSKLEDKFLVEIESSKTKHRIEGLLRSGYTTFNIGGKTTLIPPPHKN